MALAGWECENCGDKGTTLNVHHKRYVRGRMVWEYERSDLACLCEPCHEEDHADRELLERILADAGPGRTAVIIGLVTGYLDGIEAINDPGLAEQGRQTEKAGFALGMAAAVLDMGGNPQALVREYIHLWDSQGYNKIATQTVRHAVECWDDER